VLSGQNEVPEKDLGKTKKNTTKETRFHAFLHSMINPLACGVGLHTWIFDPKNSTISGEGRSKGRHQKTFRRNPKVSKSPTPASLTRD